MSFHISKADAPTGATGIFAGISNEAYHAGPGISKSGLDRLAKSPLHYWDSYINPHATRRTETPAMMFGTAVHTAVLEPDTFNSRYYIMPKVDGRTTAGKQAKAAADDAASSGGLIVIDEAMHRNVMAVANSVRQHPTLGDMLNIGVPELSVYWIDQETGILCRCRPDWLNAGLILDVKTTEDASPAAFERSSYSWRYHVQAAFYVDGLHANNVDTAFFTFAAVEKSSPYACSAFMASSDMIVAGRAEYRRLLRIYAKCVGANVWPGYDDGPITLDLPAWATRDLDLSDINAEEF